MQYLNIITKTDRGGSPYKEPEAVYKLPILEFAVGSLGLSRRQALIELGFPEDQIDKLTEQRMAEDLMGNLLAQQTLAEILEEELDG